MGNRSSLNADNGGYAAAQGAALLESARDLKERVKALDASLGRGCLTAGSPASPPRGTSEPEDTATAEAAMLDALRVLEETKRMVEARQAVITEHLHTTRVQARARLQRSVRSVPAEVAMEVGLHRQISSHKASRILRASLLAPESVPGLFAAWLAGKCSEAKILIFLDETALLTPDARRDADTALAPIIAALGERDVRERLRAFVARAEPERAAERVKQAQTRRRVTHRNRADGMMSITALLPGIAGQGVVAILRQRGQSLKASGDERTQDQIQADAFAGIIIGWAQAANQTPPGFTTTHNITYTGPSRASNGGPQAAGTVSAPDSGNSAAVGSVPPYPTRLPSLADSEGAPVLDFAQAADDVPAGFADVDHAYEVFRHAGVGCPPGATDLNDPGGSPDGWVSGIGVNVHLSMTDLSIFGITDTPAQIFGLGPVPADHARDLIQQAHNHHAATLRRLYTNPSTGTLLAMESKSRTFPNGLARMISLRDGHCRFPYCDAPIKHLDHIQPHAHGGATSYVNGQGLCAHHNLIKDANHTRTTTRPNGDTTITLGSGATFTSPARPFPHEKPATVAQKIYAAGHRHGLAHAHELRTLAQSALKPMASVQTPLNPSCRRTPSRFIRPRLAADLLYASPCEQALQLEVD